MKNTYLSSRDKFSFFRNTLDTRELITPELSYFEKQDLLDYIDYKSQVDKNNYQIDSSISNLLDSNKKETDAVPKYLLYDIYNKFYSSREEMQIKTPNKHNQWLFDFLTRKLNTYYVKGLTEQKPLISALFTKQLVYKLIQEMNDALNNNTLDSTKSIEEQLEHTINNLSSSDINQIMNDVTSAVNREIQQIDNINSEIGNNSKGAGKGSSTMTISDAISFDQMYKYMYQVNFNDKKLSNFIRDSLKFSTNYFSSIYKDQEESLLDADDVDSLEGLENLIPLLRKINLDDIVTYKRKYNFKFDVYIDISGSMGNMRTSDSQLMQAKLVALKLAKLGLVEDMYTFDTKISKPLTRLKMINTDSGGGTSISKVTAQINRLNRASVIITDASDTAGIHTNKAYFIGVPGAYFDKRYGGWHPYITNKQCAIMTNDGALEVVT